MKNKNQLYTFNPWPFILIIGALTMTFGGVLHMNYIESLFFKEFANFGFMVLTFCRYCLVVFIFYYLLVGW